MGVVQRFRKAVGAAAAVEAGPAGLPIRLARACVRVLPVMGAGLSLFSFPTMRIPIGSSDDTAATAERLQFTTAEGPCFTANHTGQTVTAPIDVIAQRWPWFHDLLVTCSPIRGIVSTPLPGELSAVGVLDLYVTRPADLAAIDQLQVRAVAGHITRCLLAEPMFPNFREGSPLDDAILDNAHRGARGHVLISMGMLNVAFGLSMDDALAVLRAYAFAHDRTVDATASDIVHRTLPTTALAPNTST